MDEPVDWPLIDLVASQAPATPDRPAMVDAESGRVWTYDDLDSGPVAGLAAGLVDANVAPGDRLGVTLEPGVRMAQLVHATTRIGACLVPLPPEAPPSVLADRAAAAGLDAVVTRDPATVRGADRIDGNAIPVSRLDGDARRTSSHRWNRDDVKWLVFTSGTTGEPRPVKLTAGNLIASATASAARIGVEDDDRWLACLPMHHVGGLAPVVRTALAGTTVVVQPTFDARETASVVTTHDVTGISLVPTMLARLLDHGWSPPANLRFVLLGGAPASAALLDRCEAATVPVWPTYGATETASQVATARPDEAFEHPGTVGRPLPGTTVSVVDGSGRPGPSDEPGELVVDGPTVSPGYAGANDEISGRFDNEGRFHTRDRGYLDDAGRLWVLGRLDDAIVTGGETVQPEIVERVLRAHPSVDDAAVVGLPDEEWGEVVGALVVADADTSAEALRDHCRAALEAHAVPKALTIADAIPRTASGTVDRAAVRARLRSGGL